MNIQSLSFGKKIPIATCRVKNNETRKFEPATLFEYDCTDMDDINEVYGLPDSWSFKYVISNGMRDKWKIKDEYDVDIPASFFVLKNSSNKTIGVSYLEDRDNHSALKFIQTDPSKKYKYAGQAILASHALTSLNDNFDKFEVRYPTDDAFSFYKDVCGFKDVGEKYSIELDKKGMKTFLRKFQFRTLGRVFDVRK